MKADALWQGEFGDAYTERNADPRAASRIALFSRIMKSAPGVDSIIEVGCNVGHNLQALRALYPDIWLSGLEINEAAAEQAGTLGVGPIFCRDFLTIGPCAKSTLAFTSGVLIHVPPDRLPDAYLAFTSGVLIHVPPDRLPDAYTALNKLSRRYILICEYYNPTPVTVPYRGTELYKRDFAGELMDRYDLTLRDYGFVYRRDNYFPLDDMTWFLLEKRNA